MHLHTSFGWKDMQCNANQLWLEDMMEPRVEFPHLALLMSGNDDDDDDDDDDVDDEDGHDDEYDADDDVDE